VSFGYVPDAPTFGDGEYFTASYLYTTSRLNDRKPAGNTLAGAAVSSLWQLFGK